MSESDRCVDNPKKITRKERFVRWFDRLLVSIFGPGGFGVRDD